MAVLNRETRHLLGKAIHHYRQIQDGDRIAVAVSGGKDSLVLLWLLRERLRWIPVRYELIAIHVDPGFDDQTSEALGHFLEDERFQYRILRTDHGIQAHAPENRENPCFLCSRLRRQSLFTTARELGCNKLALGHNQDDFIETFLINIFYGGQVASIVPRQAFFGGEMVVIRPLVLMPASKVSNLARRLQLPVLPNSCPSAARNSRQEVRTMLERFYASNSKIRGNIFHAMSHVNLEYLPPPLDAEGKDCENLLDARRRQTGHCSGLEHPPEE